MPLHVVKSAPVLGPQTGESYGLAGQQLNSDSPKTLFQRNAVEDDKARQLTPFCSFGTYHTHTLTYTHTLLCLAFMWVLVIQTQVPEFMWQTSLLSHFPSHTCSILLKKFQPGGGGASL